jgi:hypothetical protein
MAHAGLGHGGLEPVEARIQRARLLLVIVVEVDMTVDDHVAA